MELLFIIIQVIILDGILSIDNAAALAALANKLPEKRFVIADSPLWLRKIRLMTPILFMRQRDAALKVGILGAYLGRGLMLLLVGFVIQYPLLQVIGAVYLLYLVGTHFFNWAKWEPTFKGVSGFWHAVVLIELADLAFSLDNVAAVVALSPNIWIIIVGVFISIVIMRYAAGIFMKLIVWEPLLEHAAFVLIFAIAIELILKYFHVEISEGLQFAISMFIIAAFILYGRMSRRYGFARGGE